MFGGMWGWAQGCAQPREASEQRAGSGAPWSGSLRMSLIGLVQLVSRRDVAGIATAMQVVADGATRQSLESRVATLQWGPLKDLKERKVNGELDG